VSLRSARVDARGHALAGSQKWIQYFVDWQQKALTDSVLAAVPSLREFNGVLEWVSPLEDDKFREYRDEDFLTLVGAAEHIAQLRSFWPRGGPCWDALAKAQNDAQQGVVLVEAKSYPAEMLGGGCQAGVTSRAQIERAINATKLRLAARPSADWLGPHYQSANSLAHLYFFREVVRTPAWLIHVCFTNDPRSRTTEAEWRRALGAASAELGLNAMESEFSAVVFLEAKEGAG
jgi:hypothetical protein